MSASPLSFVPAIVALALPLTGCAQQLSPQARCFAEATVEYRAAWRAARAIRADLDRGYALHHAEIRLAQAVPCRVKGVRSTCLDDARQTRALPVAIDRAALARRLSGVEAKLEALRPAAMDAAAPCGFGDWAETGPAHGSR